MRRFLVNATVGPFAHFLMVTHPPSGATRRIGNSTGVFSLRDDRETSGRMIVEVWLIN
jgi:hypothetical protein